MPQLSNGGKYVFGWSVVEDSLNIKIPKEAVCEYGLCEKVILMSRSRASGTFSISSSTLLSGTLYGELLTSLSGLFEHALPEGIPIMHKNHYYCWTGIDSSNRIALTKEAACIYGVKPGDFLLSIKGSDIAFDFKASGRIVELAMGHSEIPVYR